MPELRQRSRSPIIALAVAARMDNRLPPCSRAWQMLPLVATSGAIQLKNRGFKMSADEAAGTDYGTQAPVL